MKNLFTSFFYYILFRIFKLKFVVRRNYAGYFLNVQIVDPISYEWYNRNWNHLPEIDFISNHVNNVNLIFDFGAHHGVIAMILSKTFPDSKVVSVEAIPKNHNQCLINYNLNDLNKIIAVNNAISDLNSTLYFENTSNGYVKHGMSQNLVEVKSLRIEDFINNYGIPDIVFMDIEGFEQKALDGIVTFKSILKTVFFIEVHMNCGLEENGGNLNSIFSFFTSNNSHDLFYLKEGDSEILKLSLDNLILMNDRFYLIALPNNISVLCVA